MADFNYTLGVVVSDVDRIINVVKRIEKAMQHASPASVDVLRRNKEQLERLLAFIMGQTVNSQLSLHGLIQAHRQCLQSCIDAAYNDKKDYIGRTRIV